MKVISVAVRHYSVDHNHIKVIIQLLVDSSARYYKAPVGKT